MKNILKHKLFKLGAISFLVLGLLAASLPALNSVRADESGNIITPATYVGEISIDTTSATGGTGVYTSLTGPIIAETTAGDISIGTHTLNLSGDWEFETGDTVGITIEPEGGIGLSSGGVTVTNNTLKFVVETASSENPSTLTFTGIKVRPTGATTSTGYITYSEEGATIKGVDENTDFGTLTTIPGAVAKLAIKEQPETSVVYGT